MHLTNRLSPVALGTVLLGLGIGGLVTTGVGTGQDPPVRPSGSGPETAPLPRPNLAATPSGSLLVVPIGTSKRLQMRDKKAIGTVVNVKENVAVVQPVIGDPTTVQVTGREGGTTHITLTATDGTEESYEVSVQLDVEFLHSVLRRAAPTASLEIIPAANGAIILGGTVARSEDIDIILRTAASIVGSADRVTNAMRVGGVMMVELDVVIAQVSRSELRSLSFEFLTQGNNHTFVNGLSAASAPGSLGPVGSPFIGAPSVGGNSNIALSLFNLADAQSFLAFLSALRTENVSKLLAEPHLTTTSGHSAFFNSGGEQAVPQISGAGSSVAGVTFVPFGTQVSFLPIVLGDGKIYLEIAPKVDIPVNDPLLATPIPGTSGSSFGRTSQEIHTTAVVEDGQTLVVGGLIQNVITGSTNKIPVLGDLPFIGVFFSSKSYSEDEQELVIVVTPHLVDAMNCKDMPKYLPGQETRSPDDYELFLEGILEAPRGRRETFVNGHYVPAYKNGPAADFNAPRKSGHAAGPGYPAHGSSDERG